MDAHDSMCPTNQNDDEHCWFCAHNAKVRANERAERGLANEPQGLPLAQMLLRASRSTETKTRAELRAKVKAMHTDAKENRRVCQEIDGHWTGAEEAYAAILDLLEGSTQ